MDKYLFTLQRDEKDKRYSSLIKLDLFTQQIETIPNTRKQWNNN